MGKKDKSTPKVSTKKDKSTPKKEKTKKPKFSKKTEPASTEEVAAVEAKKPVPAIQVEEEPVAEPPVKKVPEEKQKQDKAPTPKQAPPTVSPKQASPAVSPKRSPKAASKNAELTTTPSNELTTSPKTPKKQKDSPGVESAKKATTPRLSSPDVVRRTIAKKVDSSSGKSISAIIRSREVHSPSLRISSDMFKADQKLY